METVQKHRVSCFFISTYLYLELLSHLMVSVILWTAPSWGQFLGAYYQLQYLMTN